MPPHEAVTPQCRLKGWPGRYLMEDTAALCLLFDRQQRVRQANRQAREVIGADVTGKPAREVFIDFGGDLDLAALAAEEGLPHMLSISTRRPSPLTLNVRFYACPDGLIAIGERDYEDFEALQQNLMAANAEMSNLARRLQKANAELKALNELKNEFLGIAAHDLRNPIGNIYSYTDMLLEDIRAKLDEEHLLYLGSIRSLSETMLAMLDDLLDLSAIESGKLNLNRESCDVAALLQSTRDLHRRAASEKEIELRLEVTPGIPPLPLDGLKMQQAIGNLISNAIKFSLPGSSVRISARQDDEGVEIAVADQGQGIPKEEQAQLFEPFHKTSVKGTAGEKSTGLGLSIVKKIVCGHGGRVGVESEPGEGTTFTIALPRRLPEDGEEDRMSSESGRAPREGESRDRADAA